MANQIFFVVGHQGWGKTETLRALTNGNYRFKYWPIGNRRFHIRRMSNDDRSKQWFAYIRKLDPAQLWHIITACPEPEAIEFLAKLKDRYQMFFWVLRHSYTDDRSISKDEEKALRALGKVDVFEQKAAAAKIRAGAFQKFVLANP